MLEIRDLKKRFGAVVAVDGLSLDVNAGEVFGLLGPNGAGKTTTVKMAVGLLAPDSGSVILDSQGSPTDPAVRSRMGVAPQELALYDELTGNENVMFFARLQNLRGRVLKERVAWALEFAGLTDRRNGRVKTYSGGMKRRLNLAAAVVHSPDLLLLDEPTAGVDPQSRNLILEKIQALRSEGCTVVYTTHYMEEAQRLCDRVGIVDHGKLLAIDTVDNLISAHGGRSVVTAQTADGEVCVETDDPVGELQRLQQAGRIDGFQLARPDLERVFLNLTGRHLRD